MQASFGHDLGAVRVHTDAAAAASARALGALAYTSGSDVAFGAGRYAPGTTDGRLLLAHELTHVVQQRGHASAAGSPTVLGADSAAEAEAESVARRASGGERVEIASHAEPALARQEDPAPSEPPVGETSMIWFELNSDELRQDGDVDSSAHLAFALDRIERHSATFGDEQRILVHGYASVEGDEGANLDLSGRRAIRIKNLLLEAGIDSSRIVVLAHGVDTSIPGLEWNRRVEIELTPLVSAVEFEDPTTIRATPCTCPADTEVELDDRAISLVGSMAEDINRVAAARGIPPLALAGAIAEEYDAQLGFRSVVDAAQNFILTGLWEWQIDVDRYFDIHSKLLNALENDVGDANFNVRTALSLVEAGEVAVPGSPPTDAQVSLIIDYLLDEKGTVEFSGAYLARAQSLFAPFTADYDEGFQEAVLVDYFNEGPGYYDRFQARRAVNPGHTPCPGGAGCVVLYNRARLEAALSGPLP